jgi:hypothetical protein
MDLWAVLVIFVYNVVIAYPRWYWTRAVNFALLLGPLTVIAVGLAGGVPISLLVEGYLFSTALHALWAVSYFVRAAWRVFRKRKA